MDLIDLYDRYEAKSKEELERLISNYINEIYSRMKKSGFENKQIALFTLSIMVRVLKSDGKITDRELNLFRKFADKATNGQALNFLKCANESSLYDDYEIIGMTNSIDLSFKQYVYNYAIAVAAIDGCVSLDENSFIKNLFK